MDTLKPLTQRETNAQTRRLLQSPEGRKLVDYRQQLEDFAEKVNLFPSTPSSMPLIFG